MNSLTMEKGHYAAVNGINLYYQIYGEGQPLILLHGGFGAIEMFGEMLSLLAKQCQVIGVDLQAHGRTADINRPLSNEAMADDVAALIRHLGFQQADVMGFSLGGGVALQCAIRHPECVRKLVVVSAPCARQGWYPEILESMSHMGSELAEAMKQTPMYELYAQLAPRVEDWPVLLAKMGELQRQEYDWSAQVAAMKTPTLLVVGDADMVRLTHIVHFFGLLGGGQRDGGWDRSGVSTSRLAVLPGVTHYEMADLPLLAKTVLPFLQE